MVKPTRSTRYRKGLPDEYGLSTLEVTGDYDNQDYPRPSGKQAPPRELTTAPIIYALLFGLLPQVITGVVDLPANKFMKETLGWSAVTMSLFGLICSIPGYFAPALAYLRDRWSPFGMGDRGFFLIAAPLVAFACLWNGFGNDTFNHFTFGALVFGIAFLLLGTASEGVNVTLSQRYGIGSKLAPFRMIGIVTLAAGCAVVGGVFADRLSYRETLLILTAGACVLFAFGLWKPKRVDLSRLQGGTPGSRSFADDLRLLFSRRAYWMVICFSMLWQFNTMSGTVMLFFWRDRLHLTMEEIGRVQGVTGITTLPPIFAYALLASRFDLRRLMTIGIVLSSIEYVPLLWAHNLSTAYLSSITVGLLVAFVNTGLGDLQWRSCPAGIEASSMAIIGLLTGVVGSLSAILGAWILQKYGLTTGFTYDVLIESASSFIMLPFMFLIPVALPRSSNNR